MRQITLKYDNLTYKTFNALGVFGIEDIDAIRYSGFSRLDLTGTYDTRVHSFQRLITLDLGVLTDPVDWCFLYMWDGAAVKSVIYAGEEIKVVHLKPEGFANQWDDDTEYRPHYVLELLEQDARTTDPSAWAVAEGDEDSGALPPSPLDNQLKEATGKIVTDSGGNIIIVEPA